MSGENPQRVDGAEVQRTDDGIIVHVREAGRVAYLDPTGAILFELADGTRDVAALAAAVGELFDLGEPPVQRTLDGLRKLAEAGLIT
ncbi:MAG: PqqD family protein [Acidimicrobiales bacterium]